MIIYNSLITFIILLFLLFSYIVFWFRYMDRTKVPAKRDLTNSTAYYLSPSKVYIKPTEYQNSKINLYNLQALNGQKTIYI